MTKILHKYELLLIALALSLLATAVARAEDKAPPFKVVQPSPVLTYFPLPTLGEPIPLINLNPNRKFDAPTTVAPLVRTKIVMRPVDMVDCNSWTLGGDTPLNLEKQGYMDLYFARVMPDPANPDAPKDPAWVLFKAEPSKIDPQLTVQTAVGQQPAKSDEPTSPIKVTSLEMGGLLDPMNKPVVLQPTKYVVELGKKDSSGTAPVTAIGQKNEGFAAEGTVDFKGVALFTAKLDLNGSGISSSNVADIRLVRVPLGAGVSLIALGRTAFRVVSNDTYTRSSFQPGAGVQVEVPTGHGSLMRIGVLGGPDFMLNSGDTRAPTAPVSGAFQGGVEVPLF